MAGSNVASGAQPRTHAHAQAQAGTRSTSLPRPNPQRRRLAPPFAATRRRLVAINLAVVTAILAVMALAVYVADAHAIDQQIDQELMTRVSRDGNSDVLAVVLTSQRSASQPAAGGADGERSAADGADSSERYEPSSPNVFVIGLDRLGHAVYDPGHVAAATAATAKLPDLAAAQPVLVGASAHTLMTVGDEPPGYRVYTAPLVEHGQIIGAIQVGTSLDARERQLHDLMITLALVGLAVMVITALASLYLAERALDPARRAFDHQRQFASAASHELRTPLAFVRSQGELVLRQLNRASSPDTQQLSDDMRELVDEVDYMARLVRDLLLLARDAHDLRDAQALAGKRVDLSALAAEVVERMHPLAEAYAVELAADLPRRATDAGMAVSVRGDSDRLRQLLLILVENALKFTPAGGRVEVSVRARAGKGALLSHLGHAPQVEIEVRDTGIGISPEHLEDIFAPFYQASDSRAPHSGAPHAEDHRGAGLGLALARWIVEAHGGTIMVDSAVGQGSAFRVALPLADDDDDDGGHAR